MVKARDIIKGWPRSRSTLSEWENWKYHVFWSLGWFDSSLEFVTKAIEEKRLETEYHEAQQKMVDDYRAWYRLPVEKRAELIKQFTGREIADFSFMPICKAGTVALQPFNVPIVGEDIPWWVEMDERAKRLIALSIGEGSNYFRDRFLNGGIEDSDEYFRKCFMTVWPNEPD